MIDAEAIAELFSAFGPVSIRRMFGAAGLYSDGVFFAIVDDGVVYLKADDETQPRFKDEGCKPLVYRSRGRDIALSYWRVPERLYDDPDELAAWARQACGAALRARTKKPRKTAAPKTSGKPARRGVKRPARSGRDGIRGRSRK